MTKEAIAILSTTDVVNEVQKKLEEKGVDLSKTVVKNMIDSYKEVVTDAIKNGDEVHMQGFMNIGLTYRSPRKGFNIAKKESITIPEGVSVTVRPSSVLKNLTKSYSPEFIKLVKDSE